MGELRPWHIVVIMLVVFVLFGYKKLPDATRSLGRSLRILKTEVKTLQDEREPTTDAIPQPAPIAAARPVGAPATIAANAGITPPNCITPTSPEPIPGAAHR